MYNNKYWDDFIQNFHELGDMLRTQPRSAKARKECKTMRMLTQSKCSCPNCGAKIEHIVTISEFGSCAECGRIYDRMMASKSKIVNGYKIGTLALERLATYYANAKYLPYALRGNVEHAQDIVDKIDDVIYWQLMYENKVEEAAKYAKTGV